MQLVTAAVESEAISFEGRERTTYVVTCTNGDVYEVQAAEYVITDLMMLVFSPNGKDKTISDIRNGRRGGVWEIPYRDVHTVERKGVAVRVAKAPKPKAVRGVK